MAAEVISFGIINAGFLKVYFWSASDGARKFQAAIDPMCSTRVPAELSDRD
jgi:hypothetical protein